MSFWITKVLFSMKREGDDANFDISIYGLIKFSSLCNSLTCVDDQYETDPLKKLGLFSSSLVQLLPPSITIYSITMICNYSRNFWLLAFHMVISSTIGESQALPQWHWLCIPTVSCSTCTFPWPWQSCRRWGPSSRGTAQPCCCRRWMRPHQHCILSPSPETW